MHFDKQILIGNMKIKGTKYHKRRIIIVKKYEYKCAVRFGYGNDVTDVINEYKQQGWELVFGAWCFYYFRKPIKNK